MANLRDPRKAHINKLKSLRQKYVTNRTDRADRAKNEILAGRKRSSISTDSDDADVESIGYSEVSDSLETDSYIEDSKRVYRQQQKQNGVSKRSKSKPQTSNGQLAHHQHQLVQHSTSLVPADQPQEGAMTFGKGGGSASVAPSQYTQQTGHSAAFSHGNTTIGETNFFSIPTGTRLSPRADVWFLLAFLSSASIASLAQGTSPQNTRSSSESMALILASFQLVISAIVAVAYRYAPSRFTLTKGKFELVLSLFYFIIVSANTALVMNPNEYIGMSGSSIWNANVFYSSWISFYAASYLVGDLTTTDNHFGTVCEGYTPLNSIAKVWFVFLVSSITVSGVTLHLQTGAACSGILGETAYCERALLACMIGFLGMAVAFTALAIYRISSLGDRLYLYYNVNHAPMRWFDGEMKAKKNARFLGTILAVMAFVLNAVNVGLVSSPSGPGAEVGSVFVTTWMTLLLSLILCKKYIDSFMKPLPRNVPASPVPQVSVAKNAVAGNGWKDSSFHSRMTDATDLDDSDKLCNNDQEELDAIEDGSMSHTEMMDQLKALGPGASNNNSGSTSKHNNLTGQQQQKMNQSMASSLSSSYTGPMIGLKDEPSVVSSLGQSRFTSMTQEPQGFKAGYSQYGGNDATPRQGDEPPQGYPSPQNMGPDASGFKQMRQQSMYGNMYAPQEDADDPSESQDFTPAPGQGYGGREPHLSPLQEASEEGSSRYTHASSSASSSRRSRSASASRSKRSDRSSSTGKKSKSSKPSLASRQQQRMMYPPHDEASESVSIPMTEGDEETGYSRGQPSAADHSRGDGAHSRTHHYHHQQQQQQQQQESFQRGASSDNDKSDFDIIVSDTSSVVTELTNEGFDAPPHLSATKPSNHKQHQSTIYEDEGYESKRQQKPQLPKGFPQRMPLYNGSEASTSQSEITGVQARDRMCVDALVASALAHARNINEGLSSGGEGSISTHEASMSEPYQGGGVSSGSGTKSGESRSGSRGKNRQHKQQRPSSTSRNSKRSSKQSSTKSSNRPRSAPNQRNPSRKRSDQSYASSRGQTDSEGEQVLKMKNGQSTNSRRKSIQSFYSETGTVESMGEFAC